MRVRTGVFIMVLRRPCFAVPRTVLNSRSMVAALMDNRLSRTVASNGKCPWRSMASTSPAITWAEPLSTDSIGGLPKYRPRLPNRLAVDSRSLSRFWRFLPRWLFQHPDGVLAMKAGHLNELVKGFFLLVTARGPVASRHPSISSRLAVTLNSCPLNLPPVPFIGTGNTFHEATGRVG
jgi:hypothetical protein